MNMSGLRLKSGINKLNLCICVILLKCYQTRIPYFQENVKKQFPSSQLWVFKKTFYSKVTLPSSVIIPDQRLKKEVVLR